MVVVRHPPHTHTHLVTAGEGGTGLGLHQADLDSSAVLAPQALARAVLIVDEGDGGRGSGANVQWDRS